jgi:hypothetical protein
MQCNQNKYSANNFDDAEIVNVGNNAYEHQ